MQAFKRNYLAPFIAVGAILLTAVPAAFAASAAGAAATATHSAQLGALRYSCPAGTNWDNLRQICD